MAEDGNVTELKLLIFLKGAIYIARSEVQLGQGTLYDWKGLTD